MSGIYTFSFVLFAIIIFQAVTYAASVESFSGIARVNIENASNLYLDDEFIFNIGTSLEGLLFGVVDGVTIVQDGRSEEDVINISFHIYIDKSQICFSNELFYYDSGISTATYSVQSISMQNFPNDFEGECLKNKQNVAYFVYIQEECQFESFECESNLNLTRLYRYEFDERFLVLYSFFCIDAPFDEFGNNCTHPSDWLQLQWQKTKETCSVNPTEFNIFKPSFDSINNTEIRVVADTLPFFLTCDSINEVGPPVLHLSGDQTWDKLPDWMKVCLQVFNGVSLVALLFCLLTFATFRELRNTHGKNVLSLVIATLLSLVYTSGYIPLTTDNRELCAFIASLIYYSVLVPNYWWTAVAIFLAWALGRKGIHRMDKDSGSHLFLILSIFAWGLPLVFSLLVAFLHIGGIKVFDIDENCWIIKGWPTYLITVQTFIPFLVDCALFVLVLYRLKETQLEMKAMNSGEKNRRRNERQLTIKLAAIFGVFWLPSWIIYVAFLFKPLTSLAIITQLLNQLTTFILPIVVCCNRRVVSLWKVKFEPFTDRLTSFTRSTTLTNTSQSDPLAENTSKSETPVDSNKIQLQDIQDK